MNLFEALKKPFLATPEEIKAPSNTTSADRTIKTLSDQDYEGTMVFSDVNTGMEWGVSEGVSLITYQNKLIDMYRTLAKNPDVNNAIDMIINEMVFTIEDEEFKINIDEENNTIKDRIGEVFRKIQVTLNTSENLHQICRQAYIDGQLNIALTFDENKKQDGIKAAKIIEPQGLYFDKDNRIWKYTAQDKADSLYEVPDVNDSADETYTVDELVHVDFGLHSKVTVSEGQKGTVNLSYLENAFKAANALNTLENLLIPMRYSRSVSRRMFNIDVADLPPKKAKELMDKIRAEFKYKKTYDAESGLIKNMMGTQPLVEDYWMSNRSGARGTTVDTMDEKGGLMDMDDIIYTTKKLFSSLKIPSSRNPYIDENGGDFSFDTQDTSNEDISFYLHVDRLRIPIVKMYKEILKREIISTGVMKESEWAKYKDKIKIEFTSKSIFLENMEKDLFIKSIDNWSQIKEEVGVIVSFEDAIATVFGRSNDQLKEQMEKIKGETNNSLYSPFYSSKNDEF